MNVGSLCSREVVGIAADASVGDAAALMGEEHVGCLVVMTTDEPPQVVGLVTDRDLALDVLGRGRPQHQLLVGHLAKAPPMAVPSSASLQDAAACMEQGRVRRLLVVDDDGGVVGLLAAEDLIAAISAELATLARALQAGIEREKDERQPIRRAAGPRPVVKSAHRRPTP